MIRKANYYDLDRITEIYDQIHDFEEAGKLVIGWIRNVYPVRKTAEVSLARDDLFVLEDGGVIVASAIINQIQVSEYADASWEYEAHDGEIMILHTLTVDPFRQGKGYGKTFVEFYEQYAKEHHCKELRMDTNAKNAIARRMYQKLGYKETDIVPCVFNGIPDVMLVCLEKHL